MPSKATISLVKSLHQRKFRLAEESFIAEGPKLVEELLRSSFITHKVYALKEWIAPSLDVLPEIEIITDRELEQMSCLQTPNKVLAVAAVPRQEEYIIPSKGLHLLISQVQDPGNFGTIIRIADWFGIDSITCSPDTVELYNPKVVQATMGSIFRIKVNYTDLPVLLEKNKSLNVYATVLEGEPVYNAALSKNAFIILGNESRGMNQELQKYIDYRLRIPSVTGNDHAESLNVSVAAGIICSEFRRKFPK